MALYSHVVTDEPVVAGGMVPHLYSLGRSTETFVQKWRNANPVRPVQNRERPLCARRETGRNRPGAAFRHIYPKRSFKCLIDPNQSESLKAGDSDVGVLAAADHEQPHPDEIGDKACDGYQRQADGGYGRPRATPSACLQQDAGSCPKRGIAIGDGASQPS